MGGRRRKGKGARGGGKGGAPRPVSARSRRWLSTKTAEEKANVGIFSRQRTLGKSAPMHDSAVRPSAEGEGANVRVKKPEQPKASGHLLDRWLR